MWRTLLNQPDSYLEASGTAGFTYALLKGIRLGLLDECYHDAAWKGVDALLSRISPQGEVADVSTGTSVGHDLDHYRKIAIKQRAYGQSLTMLALTEALAGLKSLWLPRGVSGRRGAFFTVTYRIVGSGYTCSASGGNSSAFQRCCQLCAKVCIPR